MSITARAVKVRELERTPDLVDVVSAARDSGHEVLLIERPMPDAVSIAAIGRALDIVASEEGVALEDADGRVIDRELGQNRVLAAGRLWRRLRESFRTDGSVAAPATGPVAVGGFAYRPDRDPSGAWGGFPALLLRVPALAVTRVRGRTFLSSASDEAEELLDLAGSSSTARPARSLEVTAVRNPVAWAAAVDSASARLRSGEASKVVLAREVVARGDGVVSAGAVTRSLRSAYPSCFTYLITGADGTASWTPSGHSPAQSRRMLRRSCASRTSSTWPPPCTRTSWTRQPTRSSWRPPSIPPRRSAAGHERRPTGSSTTWSRWSEGGMRERWAGPMREGTVSLRWRFAAGCCGRMARASTLGWVSCLTQIQHASSKRRT